MEIEELNEGIEDLEQCKEDGYSKDETIELQIPRHLNNVIETFIQDDRVKKIFGYTSIQDFVIKAIEGVIKADKDTVLEES
jgi:hypothetical protein